MERFFDRYLGKDKITALISLGRPWNGVLVSCLTVMGALMAFTAVPTRVYLTGGLITFLVYLAASALNDIYDVKIDNVNMPHRPLPKGIINTKTAFIYAFACYTLAFLFSLMFSFYYSLLVLIAIFMTAVYSIPPFSLKNRTFCGNLALSINTIFLSLFAGFILAGGNPFTSTWFLYYTTLFTLSFFLISLSKDFKDITGDKAFGKITAVIKYGRKPMLYLIFSGEVLLFITLLFLYFSVIKSMFYLISSTVLIAFPFLSFIFLYKDENPQTAEKVWCYERLIILGTALNIFVFLYFSIF